MKQDQLTELYEPKIYADVIFKGETARHVLFSLTLWFWKLTPFNSTLMDPNGLKRASIKKDIEKNIRKRC